MAVVLRDLTHHPLHDHISGIRNLYVFWLFDGSNGNLGLVGCSREEMEALFGVPAAVEAAGYQKEKVECLEDIHHSKV